MWLQPRGGAIRGSAIGLVVLLLGLAPGCAGELPRNDGKAPATEAQVWPDLPPPRSDQPATPPDGYVPAPFGCLSDQDCFGQECCPTPWGVRLCQATCDP
jgi:hypothetical protein